MSKLITLLVVMANICGGALLAFHLFGWTSGASPDRIREATAYAAAGIAGIIVVVGALNDLFTSGRRPYGIAIFCCALWVASGPTMGTGTLREQLAQYFPLMIRHPALILCLYLLILSRLAAFGTEKHLGYALGLLAAMLLCINARLLGGPVHAHTFYYGVISMIGAFTVMLGMGPSVHKMASWALCILLVLGGAYEIIT